MKPTRCVTIGAAVGLAVLAAALTWQGHELDQLRRERARDEALRRQLEAAREENGRLRAAQVAAEELARLRADHAALPRLRAELEELKQAADRR